jgi:LuxR family transcriptional regulator, maltose regulon positive regulatory protein
VTASAAIDVHSPPGEGRLALAGACAVRRRGAMALLERSRTPPVSPRIVPRPRLTGLLSSAGSGRLVALVAPAGYGKTTLLCEWARQDERPFAWVILETEDNDPARLEASIAMAVERAEPDPRTGELVLVLDDFEVLRSPASQLMLAALAGNLRPELTLAVASRSCPALPIARLRAEGRVTELGPGDLALDAGETGALLRLDGLDLGPEEVADLWSRTEGWPAAAALGVLSIGDPSVPAAAAGFGGDDRLVADYVRHEVLRGLPAEARRLLLETAILETLSGPLCDHVLERTGSAAALSELAREQRLLIQLDRNDERFRHRRLVAEMLRAELQGREPARAAELHRRAGEWHAAQGEREPAIRHALGAGEVRRAAELVWSAASTAVSHGRKAEVEDWLALFGDADPAAAPLLALARATTRLASGDGPLAEHWAWTAAAAASPTEVPVEAGVCFVRAALARGGLERMRDDAERAFALEPEASPRRAACRLLAGTATLLTDRGDEAISQLQDAARRAAVTAPDVHAASLTQLALAAIAEGEWEEATELVTRARAQVERYRLDLYPTSALVFAASALVRAHRGRVEAAQQDFQTARRLQGRTRDVAAWYQVELAVVLARTAIRLSDLTGARALLTAASRAIRQVRDASALAAWLRDSWAQLDSVLGPEQTPPSSLTMAELRILRFLPTHLSFREIAERVYVSANTVKSQANAIYRKLDVSGRSEAVARAAQLGLLDV